MTKLRDRFDTVRPGLLRALAVLVAIVGASVALIAGQLGAEEPPKAGVPAPQTYNADRTIIVVDEVATEEARDAAAAAVETVYTTDVQCLCRCRRALMRSSQR